MSGNACKLPSSGLKAATKARFFDLEDPDAGWSERMLAAEGSTNQAILERGRESKTLFSQQLRSTQEYGAKIRSWEGKKLHSDR